MTSQSDKPMGPEEALRYLARIREGVYRVGYFESVQAMDIAIAALRSEGELRAALTMHVYDDDPSVSGEQFSKFIAVHGYDPYDSEESPFEFVMRLSCKALGREWKPEPTPGA